MHNTPSWAPALHPSKTTTPLNLQTNKLLQTLQEDTTISDYENASLVQHLHETNKNCTSSLGAAQGIEDIIFSQRENPHGLTHIELWAGSHPIISYPKLLESAQTIHRVDLSATELQFAQQEIQESEIPSTIKDKLQLTQADFISFLKQVEDASIDSIAMRFCLNYLEPNQIESFLDLLSKKLKVWGIFVANPWLPKWMIPPSSWWSKFFLNGSSEVAAPDTALQDTDQYTIVFLDDKGNAINKGTTKTWYSAKFFEDKLAQFPQLHMKRWTLDEHLKDSNSSMVFVSIKKH